ncbi:potassium channel family protein [Oxynema aestuarii]|uniref:Potassium channel protein n=1 Tax=Oxynema aestuarii AP17 TaxID=2064643 RepID=A0A6H1TZB5_9CYAN|nr:potassium channel protein [Oxynema aestuarii]QIZ70699.1 potassium channel protein [Oxynema aestuarii AP17]RMH78770.1 MAG: potassium channel protein [Cyanobacteria bacterium J007]
MYSNFQKKYRRIRNELLAGGVGLAGVLLIGTLWYWLVEGWKLSDAAYMTAITLSTVGYMEVHPLGERGRLFTVSLIAMGLVSIGYIVNRFTEALIQGYFQDGLRLRQQQRLLDTLSNHYILCGFGRTGRQIAYEFSAENIPFVVIDTDPEQIQIAQDLGYITIQADATLDATLMKVGIDRALCLVTAMPSDAENLYTVISAKTLNPKIRSIARANSEEAVQKLQRGGADAVISPYITGGRRMAAAALRPQVMDFVDGIITGADRAFYLEEFRIEPGACPCEGQTLADTRLRSRSGALVLAIRRSDGNLIGGPTADTMVLPGDTLICMGTAQQLRRLNQILSPLKAKTPRLPRKFPPQP